LEIPALESGQSVELQLALESLDQDRLERTTSPETAKLRVRLGDREVARTMLVLSAWQWPVFSAARIALAAFVLKHDGIVRSVLSEASSRGKGESTGSSSGAPGRRARTATAVEHLFGYLSEDYSISYAHPLATRHEIGVTYQSLRPPYRVLHNRRDRVGEGSCIDLTLLLAGCLEGLNLAPLVVLVGEVEGAPTHALLGAWRNARAGFRPLIRDRQSLRRAVERQELLVLETTGVCGGDRRLTYEEALQRGGEIIRKASAFHALDVAALRPPAGRILPMETPMDPVVLRAYAEATDLGRRLRTRVFETLHLLYGIVVSGGPVTGRLLSESETTAEVISEAVAAHLALRPKDGPRTQTAGYDRCISGATETARSQGSTVVRECDLWWALLWNRSRAVGEVLREAGCPSEHLVEILDVICPQSRPTTTVA
jgi:hypothetical protein